MFTIEDLIEKIYEPKSKELFRGVYTSYTQEQYRATVVMLWTVVVCDLVYKLQYLKDIYNDSTAIDILNKIEEKQKKNPKNPDWENYLVKEINERTQLITNIEKDNLEYLQKQRNLCAHPIITNENILFKPNKELTRSLMRIALDSVLLKTPLLSKEYTNIILEDFEKKGVDFVLWDDNYEKYLQNKYLNHLNINQILNLFKLLWRLVFSPHNEREINNLFINFKLLDYIFNQNKQYCTDFISKNTDYYIYDNTNNETTMYFNTFIVKNYDIYKILSEQTKALLKAEYRFFPKNIPYFFLSELSLDQYIENLNKDFYERKEIIKGGSIWPEIMKLKIQAKYYNLLNKFNDLCIKWYANSRNFNEADTLFSELIKNNFKDFTLEQLIELINQSSENDQTYNRMQAYDDHKLIMKQYIKLGGQYDNVKDTPWKNVYEEAGGVPF